MIPRYIGTAASIEALTSIRSLSVEEAEAQLLEPVLDDDNVEAVGDEAELVALADDTPGTPSEASGGARYWSVLILNFCWFFSLSCMVFFLILLSWISFLFRPKMYSSTSSLPSYCHHTISSFNKVILSPHKYRRYSNQMCDFSLKKKQVKWKHHDFFSIQSLWK